MLRVKPRQRDAPRSRDRRSVPSTLVASVGVGSLGTIGASRAVAGGTDGTVGISTADRAGDTSLAFRDTARSAASAVSIANRNDPYSGTSAEDVVNRLAADGGVQIEQPFAARSADWTSIADADATAFEGMLASGGNSGRARGRY